MKGLRKQIEADKQPPTPVAEPTQTAVKGATRKSLHFVGGYFSTEYSRAIKMLVVQEGTTIQAFVREALNDACRKRGVDPTGLD